MEVANLNVEQLMLAIINISIEIETIEKLLKENHNIPYDLDEIVVTNDDENDKGKTMGDLHRQRIGMQQQLQDRLLTHKIEPYIGSDHEGLISKVAAAMLNSSDFLEDRLRTEFEDRIDKMVKRYKELNVFFVKQKPRNLVLNRLREALECYVHGYFQGCAVLCRSTLETALREKLKEKLGREPGISKTLGPLLDEAMKLGIISGDGVELGGKIKTIGDETAHEPKRCSPSEAFQSLSNTKLLLNILYE
jgi:hypothetical protein